MAKSKLKIPSKTSKPSPLPSENPYFIYALFAVFAVFVFIFSSYKVTGDDDFFWHLASGRYIIENKVVPDKDIFGYVTQGSDWIPFEWGWDVLTYGLFNLGSFDLILVFRSLVFIFIFYILFVLLRKFKVNTVVIFVVFVTLLFAIIDRLSPRPHILSYVCFVAIIYLLTCFKYIDRERDIKKLYFLPLIFLVGGNVHMGILAGGLLLFIFTVSETIIYFYPKKLSSPEIKPLSREQLKKLFVVSVISALMLLVNPNNIQTYVYVYSHTKMKMLETVNEWRSPFDAMFGTGFVTTLYKVFLFGGIITLIYSYIKKDLTFALVYLGFVIYSVRAIRFTVDFEIITAFFFAVSLNYFVLNTSKSKSLGGVMNFILYNDGVKLVLAAALIYVIYLIPSGTLYRSMNYYRVFGYGINDEFLAVQLFDFMKENNIKGLPFNHYGTGGMLVWYFPDQKNFIDSRVVNDDIFNEYNTILGMRQGFESKLQRYGIDYVIYLDPDLVRRVDDLKRVIVVYLSKHPDEWKLVFWDDKSFLFLRNVPKFQDMINKFEYKILNPYYMLFQQKTFEENIRNSPQLAREELNRKLKSEPNGMLINSMAQTINQIAK